MVCTAFNQDALGLAAWTALHSITLHGIHCIHSGCFWPCCIKSTAFKYSAGIHCLQSCCIKSPAFNRVPFLHSAWNTLHSIMLHGIHGIQRGCILKGCMESTAFNHTAWNPQHSIGMLVAMLQIIHCIQSCCRNPLHSIMLHKLPRIQ